MSEPDQYFMSMTGLVHRVAAERDALNAKLSEVMEENARLREALEPFAKAADEVDEGMDPPLPDHSWLYAVDDSLTLGECRRARSILTREG
jgi:hypothetical protein